MLTRIWQKQPQENNKLLEYSNEMGCIQYLTIDFQSEPKINLYYNAVNDEDVAIIDTLLLNSKEDLKLPVIHDLKNKLITLHASTSTQMLVFLDLINSIQPFSLSIDPKTTNSFFFETFIRAEMHKNRLEKQQGNQSGFANNTTSSQSYAHMLERLGCNPQTPTNSPQIQTRFGLIDAAIETLINNGPPPIVETPSSKQDNHSELDANLVRFFNGMDVNDSESEDETDAYDEDRHLQALLSPEEYQRYLEEKENSVNRLSPRPGF